MTFYIQHTVFISYESYDGLIEMARAPERCALKLQDLGIWSSPTMVDAEEFNSKGTPFQRGGSVD